MNEKIKKILIIAGFLIVAVIIGYALYYFFFNPPTRQPYVSTPPAQQVPPQTLPGIYNDNVNRRVTTEGDLSLPSIERVPVGSVISESARGGYTKVNKKLELGGYPTIFSDGNLVYYDSTEGRFYKVGLNGVVSLLSSQKFYSVSNVVWSKSGQKAVLEYPDGTNIVYDFANNKQYTLPKEMQDFDFSPSGQMLAAEVIGENSDSNWIVTSDPDGGNIQFIERIGGESANVDINVSPSNQVVALFKDNAGADSQEIVFVGRQGENFKSLMTNGRGFQGQWTPDGNRLLYSTFRADNDFRPVLSIVGASGEGIGSNNIDLGLQTWAEKCTMAAAGSYAYCAVPQNLPAGSGWYPELANDLPDTFYKIDLSSGSVSLLAEPVGQELYYSASSLFLSADEKTLYFQDRSGSVYGINLP